MTRRRMYELCLAAGWAMMAAGCAQPKMDMANMKPPERAAELDQLDKWVGTWASTGEMKIHMGDKTETKNSTGTSTIAWTCDKRVLMEQGEMDAGPPMGKMSMLGVYAWCPAKKKFHTQWYDSWGGTAHGWMTFCECPKCKCWCMTAEGRDPMSGKETIGEGCLKMTDDNTMEFTWTEWDTFLGMKGAKKFEMKGTSHRKM